MGICTGQNYANALNGSIVFGDGFAQYYNSVTLNTGQILIDVSAFGGTGYQVFLPGIKHLNGVASGFLSTAQNANPFATAAFQCAQITIHFDVGCSISFQCYIGETTITENYEGGGVNVSTTFAYADSALPVVVWNES